MKLQQILFETHISRVIDKYMDHGFIIISAQRSVEAEYGLNATSQQIKKQNELNKRNDAQLKQDIRNSGYGYAVAYGGFKEAMKDPETGEPIKDKQGQPVLADSASREKSYIVMSRGLEDIENLKQQAIEWCAKYNQDSFLLKPPDDLDKNAYYFNRNGGLEMKFSGRTVDDLTKEYFTQVGKHRFSFV